MPKYRQLHLKILDSIDVNDMPDDFTRLSWVLLSLIVDGAGRGIDNPAWVRSKMYPMREDVTIQKIGAAMDWYAGRQMIGRYCTDGRPYFYIVKWSLYQTGTDKEAKSSIPAPDLLPTNSGPTPDLLRVNTIQCNTIQQQDNAAAAVFKSYENEIGMITKTISDEIDAALAEYPAEWFPLAFSEAAKNNKRSWGYARACLKRWKIEGVSNNGKNPTTHVFAEVY